MKNIINAIPMSVDKYKDFGLLWAIALPLFALGGGWMRSHPSHSHFLVLFLVIVGIIVLNLFPLKGRTALALLLPLGGLSFYVLGGEIRPLMPAIALGMGFVALFVPNLLKWPYLVWMVFATCLGWFVSRILLVLVYYLLLTPISLLARIGFKKKFLDLSFDSSKKQTYWEACNENEMTKEKYERQY